MPKNLLKKSSLKGEFGGKGEAKGSCSGAEISTWMKTAAGIACLATVVNILENDWRHFVQTLSSAGRNPVASRSMSRKSRFIELTVANGGVYSKCFVMRDTSKIETPDTKKAGSIGLMEEATNPHTPTTKPPPKMPAQAPYLFTRFE